MKYLTDRDERALADMVRWWRTQSANQSDRNRRQYLTRRFAQFFRTFAGIPAGPADGVPGDPATGVDCQPMRIDDNDELQNAGDELQKVYTQPGFCVAGNTVVTAHKDPWGRWIAETPGIQPVLLSTDGGINGTESTPPTWTYTVMNRYGQNLLTGVDPTASPHHWVRMPVGEYVGPATYGYAEKNGVNWELGWLNEFPSSEQCVPGLGEMELQSEQIGPDIPAVGFVAMPMDNVVIPGQGGVTFDPVGNTFTFTAPGIWDVVIQLNISHNESNQGRETIIRLYDTVDLIASQGVPIPVARNQPGTIFAYNMRVKINTADVNQAYQIQLGDEDALTSVVWNDSRIQPLLVG